MLNQDASGNGDFEPTAGTQQSIVELAAELRAVREKADRSLRDLQQVTFASDSSLSRYLCGRTVPPWQVVEALCRLGGRDPAELRAVWERARQARGKQMRMVRARGIPRAADPAPDPVPAQDIPAQDAIVEVPSRIGHDRTRTVLGLLAAALAVGFVTVFVRRWRSAKPAPTQMSF